MSITSISQFLKNAQGDLTSDDQILDMVDETVAEFDSMAQSASVTKFKKLKATDFSQVKDLREKQIQISAVLTSLMTNMHKEGLDDFKNPLQVEYIAGRMSEIMSDDSPALNGATYVVANNIYEKFCHKYASDGAGSVKLTDKVAGKAAENLALSIMKSDNCPASIRRAMLESNSIDLLFKIRTKEMSQHKYGLDRAYVGASSDTMSETITDINYKKCLLTRIDMMNSIIKYGHIDDIQPMFAGNGMMCLVSDLQKYIDYAVDKGVMTSAELESYPAFSELQEGLLGVRDHFTSEGYELNSGGAVENTYADDIPSVKSVSSEPAVDSPAYDTESVKDYVFDVDNP